MFFYSECGTTALNLLGDKCDTCSVGTYGNASAAVGCSQCFCNGHEDTSQVKICSLGSHWNAAALYNSVLRKQSHKKMLKNFICPSHL